MVDDLQGIGTILLGLVGLYNAVQATLAKREASKAKDHAAEATVAVAGMAIDMQKLEDNTNSKMDQVIEATRTAADLIGEKRGIEAGIAQEAARQKP